MAKSRAGGILLPVCLFAIILAGCSPNAGLETEEVFSPQAQAPFSEVDEYIRQQMMAEDIPGLAVVVVRGSQVVYLEGFGVTSLNTPQPVTPQTVFDLASSSKSFTALAVLLLRDDGLIDLDLPVQHYLPDFQLADAGESAEITVRQLMHQTSGLPGKFSEPLAYHQGSDAMEKLIAALGRVQLVNPPGSSFEYANINYAILGALIEEVSGMPFEDYMQQQLFTPLGMVSTTMYPEEAARSERADGHQPMFGQVVARNIPFFRSAAPAGWVMSSARDMGQWLIANLNGGYVDEGQVIPGQDIMEVHTAAVLFEENGKEVSYGMGWFMGSGPDDTSLIWHGGDTPNFMSDMILLPEHQLGVVVLANSQASTVGHSIGPGVAGLILGLEFESSTTSWWAYWKAVDNIATAVLVVNSLLVLAFGVYSWWIWRQFRAKKRHFLGASLAGRVLPAWRMTLYVLPLGLLVMFGVAGYLLVKILYGYNMYQVLILFRLASPPGVWLSGAILVAAILLWASLLVFLALFTRGSRAAPSPPVFGR